MPRLLPTLIIAPLAAIGCVTIALSAMIAAPLTRPPPLASISTTIAQVDYSDLPALQRYRARDGSELAFRAWLPATPAARIAILAHGSSGSSAGMHALGRALAARGIAAFAQDMRGHGSSGSRGDIAYVGQLEDDLADFVSTLRQRAPDVPLTLIGHSSGGGFALRVAASPLQDSFAQTILLAPHLGVRAESSRPASGGWANADVPRYIGIALLERVGISCCGSLPTLAFAVAENSTSYLTATYSWRLMRNYAAHFDLAEDLANVRHKVSIIAGADDELMFADKYAGTVAGAADPIGITILPGVNHMAIVTNPAAFDAITRTLLAN